jgi:hypothetical protein
MKLKQSLPGREALPKGRTSALKGEKLQIDQFRTN